MPMIGLILYVFAFVLFVISGLSFPPDPWRFRFMAWAAACITLALILSNPVIGGR